jgi:hypothetical protein
MSVRFSELSAVDSQVCPTTVKPYSTTELKVFRAELKGLFPGTEYKFQIGSAFPSYRFRTMPSQITDEFRFVTGGLHDKNGIVYLGDGSWGKLRVIPLIQ